MDFDLTDDQKEIKRVAKELLADRSPFAKVREAAEAGQYDGALWHELQRRYAEALPALPLFYRAAVSIQTGSR